jgi:hypothetical protein
MGVLVQLKGTQAYRVALFSIMLLFSWRASVSVDPSEGILGKAQGELAFIVSLTSFALQIN